MDYHLSALFIEHNAIDSFHFAGDICQQDPNLHMGSGQSRGSFVIYKNSPLTKPLIFVLTTCTIATRIPLTSPSIIFVICLTPKPRNHFLHLTTNKQVDGVAMGSSLDSALANIFICSFERKWLRNCPNDFKPVFFTCVQTLY